MTYYYTKSYSRAETSEASILLGRGRVIFSLCLISLLLLAVGLYLWQTNSFVSQGYLVNQLKKEQGRVSKEKTDLLLTLADFYSLKNLKQRAQELSLVEAEEISYLSLPTPVPTVALHE